MQVKKHAKHFIKIEKDKKVGVIKIEQILAFCGGISIIGGAAAVIYKLIYPAFHFHKRVEVLEEHSEVDYKRLKDLEEMQKQQTKCLAAMLNHHITGNGIEAMKK